MAKIVNIDCSGSYCFKLILLGEYSVGKSSIFCRFKGSEFKENTRVTVGIDNFNKVVATGGHNVTLAVWDTVGTERFRTLTRSYFRNAHACLLVFSVNDPESLTSLVQWVEDANDYADTALKVLIANKTDCKCHTSEEKIKSFAQHHNCDIVFNVSAKTGQGIEDMFTVIAKKLMKRDNHIPQRQLFEDVHTLDIQENKMLCC